MRDRVPVSIWKTVQSIDSIYTQRFVEGNDVWGLKLEPSPAHLELRNGSGEGEIQDGIHQ